MAQTQSELETQLGYVNAAINSLLTTGQQYARPGFSLNRASLKDLMAARKTLELQLRKFSTTGVTSISDFSGGSGTSSESSDWGD